MEAITEYKLKDFEKKLDVSIRNNEKLTQKVNDIAESIATISIQIVNLIKEVEHIRNNNQRQFMFVSNLFMRLAIGVGALAAGAKFLRLFKL